MIKQRIIQGNTGFVVVGLLLAGVCTQACGAPENSDEEGGGAGGPSTARATAPTMTSSDGKIGQAVEALVTVPWGWTQSFGQNSDASVASSDLSIVPDPGSDVCLLTMVTGVFSDSTTDAEAAVTPSGGSYRAFTGSGQQMSVSCFAGSSFVAPGSARWVSGQFSTVAANRSGCRTASSPTWWGDASTFITGWAGSMRGTGESVRANQSSGAFTASRIQLSTCRDAVGMIEWGQSFFAGTPSSGILANLWAGPPGVSLTMNPNDGASKETQLAPAGDAMCYFTYIGGQFDGFGEQAKIYMKTGSDGTNHWFLYIQSGFSNGRKYLTATANCMMRRQPS